MQQPLDYLVTHGRAAFVGRFRCLSPLSFVRGDCVVLRSQRGLELGEILCEARPGFEHLISPESFGELLQPATEEQQQQQQQQQQRAEAILAEAIRLAETSGLPILFLDAEAFLDDTVILQGIPSSECDATSLFESLHSRFHVSIKWEDLTLPAEPEATGCGKPGCGTASGGCTSCGPSGCSTGSCSKGTVRQPEELTAYFLGLREQMEADARRQALFNG